MGLSRSGVGVDAIEGVCNGVDNPTQNSSFNRNSMNSEILPLLQP